MSAEQRLSAIPLSQAPVWVRSFIDSVAIRGTQVDIGKGAPFVILLTAVLLSNPVAAGANTISSGRASRCNSTPGTGSTPVRIRTRPARLLSEMTESLPDAKASVGNVKQIAVVLA
jgi:hypothetical protein